MPHKEEHKYIPKNLSKDFRTRHGCECKEEYEYRKDISDKKYTAKNECVLGRYQSAWCRTKDSCGRPTGHKREREQRKKNKNDSDTWDYCVKASGEKLLGNDITFGKGYLRQQILGIVFFIIVFIITIPTFLYKFHFHEILEVYMPNFDLLATAVSFQDGATGFPYFQELYGREENLIGWLSTLFINYLSLLGLTYLVARRVHITKSLRKGWGIGFVMLLLTYLVPNVFITFFQNKVSDFLQNKFLPEEKMDENLGNPSAMKQRIFDINNVIVLLVGLGIAALFILTEVTLLKHQKYWLDPFVKRVLLIDDFLDKI